MRRASPPNRVRSPTVRRALGQVLGLLLGLVAAVPAAAQPTLESWPDYEVMLWQRQPAAAYATLPRLGYSGALVFGQRAGIDPAVAAADSAPLRAAGLRWFVENIATDFYSAYHRWTPNRPVNWAYLEVQRRYRENPADPTLFWREPSLSDPAWLARIRDRMAAHARVHRDLARPGEPYYLNLGDEPGIADLSAAWDFDMGPHALAEFRAWLRAQYGSLAALEAHWGRAFASWEAVEPETTDAALARTDGNHAAWSDFKAWMDIAFAAAVAAGRDGVRGVDPRLRTAIGGGQQAGWGGWDYSLLAPAIDVLEAGEPLIAQAFNPQIVTLNTSFNEGPAEWHRLWREVMRGLRGTLVWEEGARVVAAYGTPGPRGLASAGIFAALRGGLPAQLYASLPEQGRVGLLYSQASFRMRWLLDRREAWQQTGASWAERGEEIEHLSRNAWRDALRRGQRALLHQGITPRFLSPAMLAAGVPEDMAVLILPHAIALSDAEAEAIRRFAARGGVLVADAEEPGRFDGRGRLRDRPALAGLPLERPEVMLRDASDADPAPRQGFAALLRAAGAAPAWRHDGPAAEMRAWRNGAVQLIALHRDLGDDGAPQTDPGWAWLELPAPALLRPFGAGPPAVAGREARLPLDPIAPVVLVVAPSPLPGLRLDGVLPALRLALDGPSPAAAHMIRIELLDPEGAPRPDRQWVLPISAAAREWGVPSGAADRPGRWRLRVSDLLGGAVVERAWDVP
jgi:hypothetical protein